MSNEDAAFWIDGLLFPDCDQGIDDYLDRQLKRETQKTEDKYLDAMNGLRQELGYPSIQREQQEEDEEPEISRDKELCEMLEARFLGRTMDDSDSTDTETRKQWRKIFAKMAAKKYIFEYWGSIQRHYTKSPEKVYVLKYWEHDGDRGHQTSMYIGSNPTLVHMVRELLRCWRTEAKTRNQLGDVEPSNSGASEGSNPG